jgi:hypothetical protein
VILCVVSPVLHRYELEDEAVSTTLPPEQKVVGSLAVMLGVGFGFLTVVIGADTP